MTLTNPMHPGKFLKDAYMKPLKLSNNDLAKAIGVSPATISRVVSCKSDISVDMSIMLSIAFTTSELLWINMQTAYNVANSKIDKESIKTLS
jgi:addiction module HigA family antidote